MFIVMIKLIIIFFWESLNLILGFQTFLGALTLQITLQIYRELRTNDENQIHTFPS